MDNRIKTKKGLRKRLRDLDREISKHFMGMHKSKWQYLFSPYCLYRLDEERKEVRNRLKYYDR